MDRKQVQNYNTEYCKHHDEKLTKMGFSTQCCHSGQQPDLVHGGVNVPIFTSSTFIQCKAGEAIGPWFYSRLGNPTRSSLERQIAALENGKNALIFSTGMSAVTACVSILQSGDEIISQDELYGGSQAYFRGFSQMNNKLKYTFNDFMDLEVFKKLLNPNVKMIYVEAATNPGMKVCNIPEISKIAHEFNKDIIVVVDNTFLSPYNFKPLDHGADICLESATKYLNGHSDLCMGILITKCDELHKKLFSLHILTGAVPSAFDCYLCIRGLKTLGLRMEQHNTSGLKIAQFLEKHKNVSQVFYPGLEKSKFYDLSRKLHKGIGGVISFIIKGGLEESKQFLEKLKLFACAVSLGSVESLAEHPALMTHSNVAPELRKQQGIEDGLIRLSVGIENVEDLIADLDNALNF